MTDVVTPHANQVGSDFLSLDFECDLRESREVSRCVRRFLAAVPLAESDLHAWELMVTEAANNATEYTTETGRQQKNRLEVFCREKEIEIRLTDHTAGFDMPAEAKLPSIESEKGRGLYLIQSLADEVEYLRGRVGELHGDPEKTSGSSRGRAGGSRIGGGRGQPVPGG